MPTGTVKANDKGNFYVSWNGLVNEGANKGAFYLAPGDAPLSFMLLVPITIQLDFTPITILNPLPLDGATVNTNRPSFAIQLASSDQKVQLDDTRTRIYVDNIDITGEGKVNRDYMAGNPSTYYPGGIVVQLRSFSLADGEHMAKVIAYDWAGNMAVFAWRFFVLSTAPGLMVTSPTVDTTISKCDGNAFTISGIAPGASDVIIYAANILNIKPSPSGEFTANVQVSPNSENTVTIEASNAAGNKVIATKTIICDTLAPPIISFTTSRILTSDAMAQVSFKINVDNEPGTYSALVNGVAAAVLSDGSGIANVPLLEGANTLTLTSIDQMGNTVTSTLSVTKDSTPPVLVLDQNSIPSSGYTDQSTITVKGTFKDLLTNVTVTVNGKRADTTGKDGSFSVDVQLYSWSNTIVVTATDQAGNSVNVVKSVGYVIKGTNYGYILGALAVVLAVLGAIIGFMLGRGAPPPPPEEEKKEEGKEETPPPPPEEEKTEEGKEETPPPPADETPPPPPDEVSVEKTETDVIKPE
jgi:hypothetical protein